MLLKLSAIFFLLCLAFAGQTQQTINIIPKPVELIQSEGVFVVDQQVSVRYNSVQSDLKPAVDYFIRAIKDVSGINMPVNKTAVKSIELSLRANNSSNAEAYSLVVTKNKIQVQANSYAGIFYGLQSILQTVPQVRTNAVLQVPCMQVKDEPRFKWRGMHLDVSRHFFSADVVKQYIDLMATYKLNTFHWHLVDDQGWRIEIKKYPKLTSTGAWRVDQNDKVWGSRPQAQPGEAANYGG